MLPRMEYKRRDLALACVKVIGVDDEEPTDPDFEWY